MLSKSLVIRINVLDYYTFIVLLICASRSTIQNEELMVIIPVFGYNRIDIVLLFIYSVFKLDYTSLKNGILVFLKGELTFEVIKVVQDGLNFILQ